jgi:hypothetical protein
MEAIAFRARTMQDDVYSSQACCKIKARRSSFAGDRDRTAPRKYLVWYH